MLKDFPVYPFCGLSFTFGDGCLRFSQFLTCCLHICEPLYLFRVELLSLSYWFLACFGYQAQSFCRVDKRINCCIHCVHPPKADPRVYTLEGQRRWQSSPGHSVKVILVVQVEVQERVPKPVG